MRHSPLTRGSASRSRRPTARRAIAGALAGVTFSAVCASSALAIPLANWNGTSGSFGDATKWQDDVRPDAATIANLTDGGLGTGTNVSISAGDNFDVLELAVGNGEPGYGGSFAYVGSATLNQTGGTLAVREWLTVGRLGSSTIGGTYNFSGGVVNRGGGVNSLFVVNLGDSAASVMNMSGNAIFNNTGAGDTRIGHGIAGGTLNMTDTAKLNYTNGIFKIADGFSGTTGAFKSNVGHMTMNGSSQLVTNRDVFVAFHGGQGDLTLNNSAKITKNGLGPFAVADSAFRNEAPTGGIMTLNDTAVVDINHNPDAGTNGEFWIGQGPNATGVVNLNANSSITSRRWTHFGRDGGTGTLNIRDGASYVHDLTDTVVAVGVGWGSRGTGFVNQSGGTFDVRTGRTTVGDNNGTGTYNLSGGVARFGLELLVGIGGDRAGVGTVNQNGGTADAATVRIGAGGPTGITGALNVINTGVFRQTNATTGIFVGDARTGTLTIGTGGRVEAVGHTTVGTLAGSVGTLNLNSGGTLRTQSLRAGAGAATLNLNGGTLQAASPEANFIRGTTATNTSIGASHLTVDTNGHNVGVNVALSGAGGLTKAGAGTLELTAVQSYAGRTRIEAGTLRTNATTGVSRVSALEFGGTAAAPVGQLDIAGKPFVIDYTGTNDLNVVRQAAAAGAITSAGMTATQGVGYAEASSLTEIPSLFGAVDATSVLLRLTLKGDANLSGNVNFADLVMLAQSYNQANKFWVNGDANYDGTVNFADLVSLAQNYNQSLTAAQADQLGSSFSGDFALAQSLVPEPATLGIFAAVGTLLAGRRRTQR